MLIVFFKAPLTQQRPRLAYTATKKLLSNQFNSFFLTYMNLCRNLQVCLYTVDEEDATGGVRRFCTPFFCACLSLHSHDHEVGGSCMADFWENAGSKSALGLFPSLLFHTSAQRSAPCRTAVRAPMSGRSTHLASTWTLDPDSLKKHPELKAFHRNMSQRTLCSQASQPQKPNQPQCSTLRGPPALPVPACPQDPTPAQGHQPQPQ